MAAIILAVMITAFGVFLKFTKNPGFASSKKLAWFFIIIGVLSFIAKIYNQYQK